MVRKTYLKLSSRVLLADHAHFVRRRAGAVVIAKQTGVLNLRRAWLEDHLNREVCRVGEPAKIRCGLGQVWIMRIR